MPTWATCATSAGVGPNVACSRKRAAARALMSVTGRFTLPDVALPGFGLVTVTLSVPTAAALPEARSWVDETNVVAIFVPFTATVAPFTNLLPTMVMLLNGPTSTVAGTIAVITGIGFWSVTAAPPDLVVSCTLVAVTLMPAAGIVAGAV